MSRRSKPSVSIPRIGLVEHAQISWPIGRTSAAVVGLVLGCHPFADRWWDFDQFTTGRFHPDLNLSGAEQVFHQDERIARSFAHGEKAVIVQDQRAVLA